MSTQGVPFKPETWPVDADGDRPNLCTECGTPTLYGSRHTDCWRKMNGLAPIMSTPTPTQREAFEHWFSDGGKWPASVSRHGDEYRLGQAQSAWVAWQAALASPQGEQPCKARCQYAHDISMPEYSCSNGCMYEKHAQGASQDSRPSSVAPGGQPLPQADSKEGFGDSVSAPVEPSGATLSPCAASQWISVSEGLPPLNTEVLIAFDTSPLPATGQLTMCRGIRQWCWPAENDPVGDESLRAVTHWAFMRHPSEIGEWAQVGESSSERGAA